MTISLDELTRRNQSNNVFEANPLGNPASALKPRPHRSKAEIARKNGAYGGRPLGSQSYRADIYARALIREVGVDPLAQAIRIAVIDILNVNNVIQLAEWWECARLDAVKVWLAINRDVMPYLHQRMPQALIVKPGAPGGDRVTVEINANEVASGGMNEVLSDASPDDTSNNNDLSGK